MEKKQAAPQDELIALIEEEFTPQSAEISHQSLSNLRKKLEERLDSKTAPTQEATLIA